VTREDIRLLLAAYDAQLRAHVHDRLPDSVRVERDGPLVRTVGFGNRGFVEYRDLAGLDGAELDTLIARQVQVFAKRGEPFEWKLHGHDRPADLPTACARPASSARRRGWRETSYSQTHNPHGFAVLKREAA
jgi:hypothetical protein